MNKYFYYESRRFSMVRAKAIMHERASNSSCRMLLRRQGRSKLTSTASLFARGVSRRSLCMMLICCLMCTSFAPSTSARFISPDTMDTTRSGVGTNRYAYSENDPINKSDANGHNAVAVGAAVGELIGGLITAAIGYFSSDAADQMRNDAVNNSTPADTPNVTSTDRDDAQEGKKSTAAGSPEPNNDDEKDRKKDSKEDLETDNADKWKADSIKNQGKLERQMEQRGWTQKQISEAVEKGKQSPATNYQTGGAATRYQHPETGRSVTIDNTTKGVIQVGGDGFVY